VAKSRKDWLEWFRVDRDIVDNPKVIALSATGGWDREKSVGRLIRLWCWVARHAPEGTLTPFLRTHLDNYMIDHEWISDHSECSGCQCCSEKGPTDEERKTYGQRLAPFFLVGLLDETEDGGCKVHDWWEMNGYSLRERNRKRDAEDHESPHNHRDNSAEPPRHPRAVSKPPARALRNGDGDGTETEEESKPTPLSGEPDVEGLIPLSPASDPERAKNRQDWQDGFRQFWEAYPSRPNSSKKQALKVWMGFCPKDYSTADDVFTAIMGALEDSSKEWKGREPDKIPHHVVWLRRELWRNDAQ
jgi:hypothetical protein